MTDVTEVNLYGFRDINSVPSSSQRISALLLVLLVVPKQGMVTARISVMGLPVSFMALAATRRARHESSPPEIPITALLALAAASLLARP